MITQVHFLRDPTSSPEEAAVQRRRLEVEAEDDGSVRICLYAPATEFRKYPGYEERDEKMETEMWLRGRTVLWIGGYMLRALVVAKLLMLRDFARTFRCRLGLHTPSPIHRPGSMFTECAHCGEPIIAIQ